MTTQVAAFRPNSSKSARQFKAIWFAAGSLLLAFTAAAVWKLEAPQPIWVATESPAYRDLETSVSSTGRVIPEHEFQARASFPGLIDGIDVHLGQKVMAGQVLVRMRDPYAATRVASAMAGLQATEVGNENVHSGGSQEDRIGLQTELARARMESTASANFLSTVQSLREEGAASTAEVNAATQRLQTADEVLSSVNDRLERRYSSRDVASWSAKMSEARSSLASAKASLANTIIRSPRDGTVYLIPVTENDFVSTGAELVQVADLQKLEVHASFEEADMGRLHEGAAVTIHWEGKPDRIWHGTIRHAPLAAVMSGIRSVGECIITLGDVKDDLPPNTTVTATVLTERRLHVISLPREALHMDGPVHVVYRLVEGRLVRTPVEVGLVTLDAFQVVHGVQPGDRVALHALDNRELFSGMEARSRP